MNVVIIGGDAAGMSAAGQVRRRRPEWDLRVLEKGPYTSYAACGIPYYFAGDVGALDDLVVVSPEEFRTKRNIDVRTGWHAVGIDTRAQRVMVRTEHEGEHQLAYDRLLLATGASPILPPWPGIELEDVVPLRNLEDTERVEALLARGPRRCVIVGGGYIGLEMAEAFSRRGLDVILVEKLAGLMGGVNPKVTELALQALGEHNIEVHL